MLDVTIGAPKAGPSNSGAVHVFNAPGGTITHFTKLTQSTTQLPEFGDDFGASLTESTLVGTTRSLVIGAPGKRKQSSNTRTGAVYTYNLFATTGMFGLVHSIFPGDSEPQRFGHAVITASVSGTTQSIVIGAPEFNAANGRAVIMRQSGSSMVKTHDMSGGGIGTTYFGSALAAGAIDVFTLPDPSNIIESSKAPRIWVGAPAFADVGAVHAYTTGASTAYYRHTLTQESGSPWSEWEE